MSGGSSSKYGNRCKYLGGEAERASALPNSNKIVEKIWVKQEENQIKKAKGIIN